MLDWLAVGNGWRNLYLASCALQALALGVFFAKWRLWVKHSRLGAFLAGVSVTPFLQYLWTLLLAAVWPQASKWVYIGVLPALAALYLLWTGVRSLWRVKPLWRRASAWIKRLFHFDRPALVSLCLAAAMAALLLPVCVRVATSANASLPRRAPTLPCCLDSHMPPAHRLK